MSPATHGMRAASKGVYRNSTARNRAAGLQRQDGRSFGDLVRTQGGANPRAQDLARGVEVLGGDDLGRRDSADADTTRTCVLPRAQRGPQRCSMEHVLVSHWPLFKANAFRIVCLHLYFARVARESTTRPNITTPSQACLHNAARIHGGAAGYDRTFVIPRAANFNRPPSGCSQGLLSTLLMHRRGSKTIV